MSNFYKSVNIKNFESLQSQLYDYFLRPEYSGVFDFGNFLSIQNGVPKLMEAISDFAPSLKFIGLHPSDVAWGTSVTAQSEFNITTIHTNVFGAFRYSLEIPLVPSVNSYINFYESVDKPSDLINQSREYVKFDKDKCKLLERHHIVGPFILNRRVPRAIESDPNNPHHTLTLGIAIESSDYIETCFGFNVL